MYLKEYLEKFELDVVTFTAQCLWEPLGKKGKPKHLALLTIYRSLQGLPIRQESAEVIEKATGGQVTVRELRGIDDRDRPVKIKRPRPGRPWPKHDGNSSS